MQPKAQKAKELESTFNVLADKWEQESAYCSLMSQMIQNYSYQLILKMGETAIPLIMRRIERRGGLWYHALESITGIPSPTGIARLNTDGWHSVSVKEVNAAWLNWANEQGYKW